MKNFLDYMAPYYGFYCKDENYLITAAFNPWNGEKIKSGFDSYFIGVLSNDFHNIECGNKRAIKKKVLQNIQEWQSFHKEYNICSRLYDLVIGDDAETTRATYLPMVRTYAVFRKGKTEEFDAMDYCPFCGAKLPERLDNKLSELLQKEYGLASWRDYKKAPHEFHTDEWWKKRGL